MHLVPDGKDAQHDVRMRCTCTCGELALRIYFTAFMSVPAKWRSEGDLAGGLFWRAIGPHLV